MFARFQKAFFLFRAIDAESLLSAIAVLAYHARFYLSGNKQALSSQWKDKDIILSFGGVKFSVNVLPGDLGFILEVFICKSYHLSPLFVVRPGDVCVDLGANIGTNALEWRQDNPSGRIICVEPHPDVVRRLKKNIALNAYANIEVFPYAASNKDGIIEMAISTYSMCVVRSAGNREKIVAKTRSLDSLVRELNIKRINICKIDVEGHEVPVLEGASASLGLIDKLVLEYHSESIKNKVKDMIRHDFTIVCEEGLPQVGLIFAVRNQKEPVTGN